MPALLLVDDHTIIRSGMKMIIEKFLPHFIIHEAGDDVTMLETMKHHEYELIILDINIPGTNSLELLSEVLVKKPDSKILMLSMNAEEIYAKRYLNAGARGYVRKDAPESEIKKAITNVLANKKYISEALTELFVNELNDKHTTDNPFDKLSPRELEIVHYLVGGDSSGDVCRKLSLKPSTVGTHKARIFEKMHCNNVMELNTLLKLHKVNPIL